MKLALEKLPCLLHSAQYNIVLTVQGSSSNNKEKYYQDLSLKVWKSNISVLEAL